LLGLDRISRIELQDAEIRGLFCQTRKESRRTLTRTFDGLCPTRADLGRVAKTLICADEADNRCLYSERCGVQSMVRSLLRQRWNAGRRSRVLPYPAIIRKLRGFRVKNSSYIHYQLSLALRLGTIDHKIDTKGSTLYEGEC